MELSRFKQWRKRALEGLIRDQWSRIEKLGVEVDAYRKEYSKTVKLHCEATIYMMGTAHVAGKTTFEASQVAFDNYVRKVHDLGYAQMSLIYKNETLGRAEDRYNELVIELEDLLMPPAVHKDIPDDEYPDEYECDELDAMDPPALRASRRRKRKVKNV